MRCPHMVPTTGIELSDLLITSQLLYLPAKSALDRHRGLRTSHTQLKGLTLFPDELVTVGILAGFDPATCRL